MFFTFFGRKSGSFHFLRHCWPITMSEKVKNPFQINGHVFTMLSIPHEPEAVN